MLSAQVYDVIEATRQALQATRPESVDAVRRAAPLVRFGAEMQRQSQLLKSFLLQKLYRHPQVVQTNDQARQIVRELFSAYISAPQALPERFADRIALADGGAGGGARVVADYIAGMTDRFAMREHERLTGARLLC